MKKMAKKHFNKKIIFLKNLNFSIDKKKEGCIL